MPILNRQPRPRVERINQQRSREASGSAEEQAMYKTTKWQRLRNRIIRNEPLCRECKRKGLTVPATVVDHIERARVRPDLFYTESNLQPLCDKCHNKKSARERNDRTEPKAKL